MSFDIEHVKKMDIKICSFDIFDTLLFRLVKNPTDVFLYMFEKRPEIFPEEIDGNDWKNLRMAMASKARKHNLEIYGHNEVTIEEIYQYIPSWFEGKKIMECEVECEAELSYLNKQLYSELLELYSHGKKIILISDMYLSSRIIKYILGKNGFNLQVIDNIFMSCDYNASKTMGNLYDIVLRQYDIQPEEMIHVGDNHICDIGMASKKGIKGYYYSLIREAKYNYPYLWLEEHRFEDLDYKTYTLRLLASDQGADYEEMEKFWYDIGAMILGPFLAGYAEWVLDFAQDNKITHIFSMMREGKFLTELLKNASKYRNMEFTIQNLYISRLALMCSKLETITDTEIEYLVRTHGVKVKDIFEIFHIKNPYNKYNDKKTCELPNIDELVEYLTSESVIKEIRDNGNREESNVIEYFRELGLLDSCITVDVGWKGSIQGMIGELLSSKKIKSDMYNLLIFSRSDAVLNVLNQNKIYGYIGNFGKDMDEINLIYPRLLELFLGCDDGTTIGYTKKEKVIPKTLYIDYPKEQIKKINLIQKGVLAYQDIYLKLKEEKSVLNLKSTEAKGLLRPLQRLFSNPLEKEARELGSLSYDQNFGANHFERIINMDLSNISKKEGTEAFWSQLYTRDIQWYSGINSMNDGMFYFKQVFFMKSRLWALRWVYLIQKIVKRLSGKQIILAGAGGNLKIILTILSALEKLNVVEGIIDNDAVLEGLQIKGIQIYGAGHLFQSNTYLITTTKRNFCGELYRQLKDNSDRHLVIYSYYKEIGDAPKLNEMDEQTEKRRHKL